MTLLFFDFALVNVQQLAEISNLSKLHLALYLYRFEGLHFLEDFVQTTTKDNYISSPNILTRT